MSMEAVAERLILTREELEALTGYRQPSAQLRELHRLGYWRARRSKLSGAIIVERAHYHAVCEGAKPEPSRPKLRPVTLRHA